MSTFRWAKRSWVTTPSSLSFWRVPSHLRQHLQLQMDDKSDYASTRDVSWPYERTIASWTSSTVYWELDINKKEEKHDEAVPMDVDRVKGIMKKDGRTPARWRARTRASRRTIAKLRMVVERAKGCLLMFAHYLVVEDIGQGNVLWGICARWAKMLHRQWQRSLWSAVALGSRLVVVREFKALRQRWREGSGPGGRALHYNGVLGGIYDMTYSDSDSDWRLCTGAQRGGEVYFEDFTDASVETYGKTGDGSTPAVIRGAYEQVSQVRGKWRKSSRPTSAGNGDDGFRPAVWLGKTDRADFHAVATSDGLRWTRTVRRMPVAFDAAVLNDVRTWPWSVASGQMQVVPKWHVEIKIRDRQGQTRLHQILHESHQSLCQPAQASWVQYEFSQGGRQWDVACRPGWRGEGKQDLHWWCWDIPQAWWWRSLRRDKLNFWFWSQPADNPKESRCGR